jgi:hypothetical protein
VTLGDHDAVGQVAERDAAAVRPRADAGLEVGEPPGQDRLAGLAGMDAGDVPGFLLQPLCLRSIIACTTTSGSV